MHNLKKYNQWILWYGEPQPDGSVKKIPCDPSGAVWDAHDTRVHMSYENAVYAAQVAGEKYRVGFALTANDPFFFVDIDSCMDDAGHWTPNAVDVMQQLPGAAVMLSQSGRGLHIIGSMAPYPGEKRNKPIDHSFDALFTEKRFIALTGNQLAGNSATNLTMQAHTFIARRCPPKEHAGVMAWRDTPCEGYTCTLTDEQLIDRAIKSKNTSGAFGSGVTFADLWLANGDALGSKWPDAGGGGRNYDSSSADGALAAHLAWWTGHNPERINRLMRMSALYREKWDARPDYMESTILGACVRTTGYYDPDGLREKKQEEITETLGPPTDPYCDVLAQRDLFTGHIYIHDCHMVWTPDGLLHTPAQYRVMYGGRVYAMDRDGVKTTRNAWEALTESVDLRCTRVHGLRFRPKMEPGAVILEEGAPYLNCYLPPDIDAREGDVSPFLNHIADLLPDQNDQRILLDYMAAVVQRQGEKFQWCPVIQGFTGNGKSLLYEILEYAVGKKYSHKVDAKDIDNRFNAWVQGNILGCVEEIRMAGDRQKAEYLKELITNPRMPIQGKKENQITGDNCMNFIMFSNHKDAVLKTADDRRYAVFYTAQQELRHIHADEYYNNLYDWFRLQGGLAFVADYLNKREISINVMGRAPMTSSTSAAMQESLGVAEQIILDNIELGTLGFRDGIISTAAASYVLAGSGKKMGPKALTSLMRDLGYTRHDATFCVNGERFRAYVPNDSLLLQASPSAVRDRYIAANANSVD